MNRKSVINGLAAIGMMVAAAGSAQAAVIQWNFHGNGDGTDSNAGNITVSPTMLYGAQNGGCAGPTSGPVNCAGAMMEAVGLTNTLDGLTDIIENNRGGVEDGLGVSGGIPNTSEIGLTQWIRLDLGGLGLVDWEILFNSVDGTGNDEEFVQVFNNDMTTALGTKILELGASVAGINTNYQSIDPIHGQYLYIGTTGGSSADVLLKSIRGTTTSVPEPVSLALLGFGLLGMGFAKRRSSARS